MVNSVMMLRSLARMHARVAFPVVATSLAKKTVGWKACWWEMTMTGGTAWERVAAGTYGSERRHSTVGTGASCRAIGAGALLSVTIKLNKKLN